MRFQGLHVVPKDTKHERNSRGLEPYLALGRRSKSKPRAKWTLHDYVIWALCVVLVVAYCGLVSWALMP